MTVTPRLRSSSLHNDAIGLQATNCRSWNMAGLQMQNIDYSSLYSAVLLPSIIPSFDCLADEINPLADETDSCIDSYSVDEPSP